MCGRYYIDETMMKEIRRIVKDIDKINISGDIHPSDSALVLLSKQRELKGRHMTWGFPGIQEKSIIFNARSESALNKKMFQESLRNRRCVIPASRFYEWDKSKNKVAFYRNDSPVVYMAGFYRSFGETEQFVILTTQANQSISDIHERMPLILEASELGDWIENDSLIVEFLKQRQIMLKRDSDYFQERLPF